MSSQADFAAYCTELLASAGAVRSKRMFGGYGLYVDDIFVAIIVQDTLYLKTDDESRHRFEAAGGRSVAAQNSAIVSDVTVLVGVKPDGDLTFVQRGTARQAHWLAVNQQLNPVPAGNLSLEWVQKKFVSVLTQQQNGTLKYVSRLPPAQR